MPSYKILSEFTTEENPDNIAVQPFWAIAVIRFAKPLTFDRFKLFTEARPDNVSIGAGAPPLGADLIRERPVLVVTNDVIQMQVEHSKQTYISTLQVGLAGGGPNYLHEIQPNDWIFAWICNSLTKGEEVVQKVLDGDAANDFEDGLKFVGRVHSIQKRLTQSPDGKRTVRYTLQAVGFKELDSSIFFDPALSKAEQALGQSMMEVNVGMDEIFAEAGKTSGGLSTTKIIPRFLRLLIGEGIPPRAATFGDVPIATGGTSTKESPFAYAVPKSVLTLLGQDTESKQVPSFADVLELVIGLQKYRGGSSTDPAGATPASIFTPEGATGNPTNHRTLNERLLGTFRPLPISFSNKTVWSILEEFKNPAVNEMYTALRVNSQGRVVPTLIVRQLPFSTSIAMGNTPDENKLTAHLEVPRWYCDPILVTSLEIGKSDALRLNFIHVYGQASAEFGVNLAAQILQSPPIRDEEDMKRSGLRPHMQTVACSIDDTINTTKEPVRWMRIAADFLIGQQYTLTGTCEMIGISAPICPGDNFEFDDTVYHIESVSHACSINDGFKQFNTRLTLTHGMRSDTTPRTGEEDPPTDDEGLEIYTGLKALDNLGYNPKRTVDNRPAPKADPKIGRH